MAKKLDHKFWAKYFRVYDVLNLVIPYQELLDSIVHELDIKKGDLILDAGCGTGNLAVKMTAKGAKVIGIDNCIEALDIYRQKDPKAEILVHDLTQSLPFPDNYFDKVASNNVIYALPKEMRNEIIKEIYRVLKPGGKVVISNVHRGFKPVLIYKDTVKIEKARKGLFNTIILVLRMSIPTMKMLYFNKLIVAENKGGNFDFMENNEQINLLRENKFNKISENLSVYSNQAILNSGIK